MASIIKKKELLGDDCCAFGGPRNKISSKHYRVDHYKLAKRKDYFSNGYIDFSYFEDDDEESIVESGVDRKNWKVHDDDGFSEFSN